MLGKCDRNILRAGAPWFAPGLALDYMARHAIDFWLTTEDLPHPDNRVTVDRAGRIHLAKIDHNHEPHKRLLAKLKGLLGHAGLPRDAASRSWSVLDQRIPLAGVAHQCGTVRFGEDPATSALDVNCKAHDLDNLYVVDTSFFPSSQRGEPGADGDGERAARRRPPDRAPRRDASSRRGGALPRRWRHEGPDHARRERSARASSPACSAPRR